jgi:hypothetical protein
LQSTQELQNHHAARAWKFRHRADSDEAFHWSSTLDESCQIELATKIINEPFLSIAG